MNYAIILAGGVGQRMRNSGLPKQFLKVFGKPIIIYTLEKFVNCKKIDSLVIVCNPAWSNYMEELLKQYNVPKILKVVDGGKDRQESVLNGVNCIEHNGAKDDDILVIHDGVRPLVQETTIAENIRIAEKYGAAMTVRPVIESVVITNKDEVEFGDFKNRDDTYTLTAPQSFTLKNLKSSYNEIKEKNTPYKLLDSALVYTFLGNKIHLVMENNNNIKITTPEDYYILKALIELEENKFVFGF